MTSDVSALILAGGKATRLGGIAKHLIAVDGEPIFARQVRVLAPLVAEILVSGAEMSGFRTVRDEHATAGPLAGIAAGLAAASTPWLVVVAGDMPYITRELVEAMLALRAEGGDGVGVRSRGKASPTDVGRAALPQPARSRIEPLVCVLHARARAAVMRRLAAHRFQVSGLFVEEGLTVAWLDDPDPRALVNINTPDDLRE